MFRRVISKYGLATHLAILTAAPIIFAPILSPDAFVRTLLWLSFFALVWIFASPSIRAGEHSSTARERVFHFALRDPIILFFFFCVIYALVRYLNSGIALAYNPESATWAVKDAPSIVLPGAADNVAYVPFIESIALFVVILGVRGALGFSARMAYALIAAMFIGITGLLMAFFACMGDTMCAKLALVEITHGPFMGSLYGPFLLFAVTAAVQAELSKWVMGRFFFILALAGTIAGLILFAPPLVAGYWFMAAVILAVFSLMWLSHCGTSGGVARVGVVGACAAGVPLSLYLAFAPAAIRVVKALPTKLDVLFPPTWLEVSGVLSRLCKTMWVSHPWLGTGLGTFHLHAPFLAQAADFQVLGDNPQSAINGYWMLLSERGIIGTALILIGVLFFVTVFILGLIRVWKNSRSSDESDKFIFSSVPLVWVFPFVIGAFVLETYITPVFSQPAAYFTLFVPLALAAASFPPKSKSKG